MTPAMREELEARERDVLQGNRHIASGHCRTVRLQALAEMADMRRCWLVRELREDSDPVATANSTAELILILAEAVLP